MITFTSLCRDDVIEAFSEITLDAYNVLVKYLEKWVFCVAYGCNTESGVHTISMFWFRKDKTLRKKWIQRLNRGKSATRNYAPNAHSKLCMKHFEGDQFVSCPSLTAKIGFIGVGRVRLKLVQCQQSSRFQERWILKIVAFKLSQGVFIMLTNVRMLIIAGNLTFMSMINCMLS